MRNDLGRKIIFSLVVALLIYIALALYSDWSDLAQALTAFPWLWMLPVVALTLVNYGGRLLRWHWYLRLLGVEISLADTSRIFGVGMLMVMTPGKAGEFLKSYMIKNVTGTPISVTAPTILAERMLDGLAMLILAAVGLFAFPYATARWVAVITFACFVLAIILIQIRPLALRLLQVGRRMPGVKRFAGSLSTFYESSYTLFKPRNLLISIGIGMVCWAAVGLAYAIVLIGFGATPTLTQALIAIFIFCISTVIGAVFAMPGGLGGVEGSLIFLSTSLLELTTAQATAAALLTRFCTLWMGVAFGVVSFVLWSSLLAGSENGQREQVAVGD